MALLETTLFGTTDKVKKAIDRIKTFEPLSTGLFETPYYVAYSGGKDSDCIRILCELAGVPYELANNHTTVDAPETVRYIRSIVPKERIHYPEESMWQLIVRKRMPPTRIARYCCEALKEQGGRDRFVMTGVRWAESTKRKNNRSSLEIQGSRANTNIILNADNDEHRRTMEICTKKGKRMLNPIVDWTDADVWEFLHHYYKNEWNPLYDEGFKRIGCVGCPMAQLQRIPHFLRWPKHKENYIRAFDRMVKSRIEDGLPTTWNSGEEVFNWWMKEKNMEKPIEGQMEF